MLAKPGHAAAAMQAMTLPAAAATWPQTATQSSDRVTPTACQRAGVRTAKVRLASVAMDMVEDDGMVAMESQAAMMEQQSFLIQWTPARDRRVATFIAVTP